MGAGAAEKNAQGPAEVLLEGHVQLANDLSSELKDPKAPITSTCEQDSKAFNIYKLDGSTLSIKVRKWGRVRDLQEKLASDLAVKPSCVILCCNGMPLDQEELLSDLYPDSLTIVLKPDLAEDELQQAVVLLDELMKRDITELKSMAQPPQPIMVVLLCVMILRPIADENETRAPNRWRSVPNVRENETGGWQAAKLMLSNVGFVGALKLYDKDRITTKQVKEINALLAKLDADLVNRERMKSVSKAGYALLKWVEALMKYNAAMVH